MLAALGIVDDEIERPAEWSYSWAWDAIRRRIANLSDTSIAWLLSSFDNASGSLRQLADLATPPPDRDPEGSPLVNHYSVLRVSPTATAEKHLARLQGQGEADAPDGGAVGPISAKCSGRGPRCEIRGPAALRPGASRRRGPCVPYYARSAARLTGCHRTAPVVA